ncbi:hypothetical protein [Rivibacter subsaxonicus]|nr:hypothetical protein [Rivibacter subsaxonicus]
MFTLLQQLRCGGLLDRVELASASPDAAARSPSDYLLEFTAVEKEIRRLESGFVPIGGRMTVFPSRAGVMYCVLTVQSGSMQWRHIVPMSDSRSYNWLEEVIAKRMATFACHVLDTGKVNILQLGMNLPQDDGLLRLVEEWPELAPEDKVIDCAVMLRSLASLEAIGTAIEGFIVQEVNLVVHWPWLAQQIAGEPEIVKLDESDIDDYARIVH